MTEELALKQVRIERGAVNRDHRRFGPRAQLVNRFGDDLLAGAAFPAQKHRCASRGDLLHDVKYFAKRGGFPYHVLQPVATAQLLLQSGVFFFQVPPFERSRDAHLQLVNLHPPFGEVVIGPMLHRLHRHILGAVSGHQDADRRARHALGTANQFKAILLIGHPQIGQDHVKVLLLQKPYRRLDILGQVNIKVIFQSGVQPFAGRPLVIHYE